MSGFLMLEGCKYWQISNKGLFNFIMNLQEVGKAMASGDREAEFVAHFDEWIANEYFNGSDFILNERFPTADTMEFWQRVCCEVARRLFRREMGGDEDYQICQIGFAMYASSLMGQYAGLDSFREKRARGEA